MNLESQIYKECKALEKDEKSKAWSKNLYNTKKDVFGLYTKEINDIIKKYKNEIFENLNNRNTYEKYLFFHNTTYLSFIFILCEFQIICV